LRQDDSSINILPAIVSSVAVFIFCIAVVFLEKWASTPSQPSPKPKAVPVYTQDVYIPRTAKDILKEEVRREERIRREGERIAQEMVMREFQKALIREDMGY
jgi:hypothetical protein